MQDEWRLAGSVGVGFAATHRPCVRGVCWNAGRGGRAQLIDRNLLVTADSALVIVLIDADGVDELFFGVEGIAKGTCYQLTFNLPATLVLGTRYN